MNSALDHPQALRLEGEQSNIQVIQAEQYTHLVILCQKKANQQKVDEAIRNAVALIRKGK